MTGGPSGHSIAERCLQQLFPHGRPGMLIGEEWRHSAQRTMPTSDPSTGELIGQVPCGSASEVDEAVRAADAAQPAWAHLSVPERAALLGRLADVLEAEGEHLATLESVDSGNPLRATRRDVGFALAYLRQWPAQALAFAGRATRPFPDGLSYTLHKPYGVVGRIVAYNHPSLFALAGLIHPLMAGNTIVIKAADQTPLGTLAVGALARRVLPPGVVNVVSGDGSTGDALTIHPNVKRLSFVGSGRTARVIQSRLAVSGMVKHFSAELGGKNAMIVCADVDVDAAVDAALAGTSLRISQGQSCQATARLLVHERVHDAFCNRLAARLNELVVGPAYDETCDMGPIVSEQQLTHILSFLDDLPPGAQIRTGGTRPEGLPPNGHYLRPTFITGDLEGHRVLTEEVFGPIVTAQPWADEDEVLRMANATDLGLSAAVWSDDIDQALRLAHQVDAGYVWVNDANRHYAGAPFGGVKGSGIGREESVEELHSYTETCAVNVRIRPAKGAS